ncbi:MAG: ribbon-helix-helix protein, CopG family [Cognaticolwellia aestuarii]
MENRTARLTILIDPKKKKALEELCALEDMNSSQKVRQLIREYIESKLGDDWREKVLSE